MVLPGSVFAVSALGFLGSGSWLWGWLDRVATIAVLAARGPTLLAVEGCGCSFLDGPVSIISVHRLEEWKTRKGGFTQQFAPWSLAP